MIFKRIREMSAVILLGLSVHGWADTGLAMMPGPAISSGTQPGSAATTQGTQSALQIFSDVKASNFIPDSSLDEGTNPEFPIETPLSDQVSSEQASIDANIEGDWNGGF